MRTGPGEFRREKQQQEEQPNREQQAQLAGEVGARPAAGAVQREKEREHYRGVQLQALHLAAAAAATTGPFNKALLSPSLPIMTCDHPLQFNKVWVLAGLQHPQLTH